MVPPLHSVLSAIGNAGEEKLGAEGVLMPFRAHYGAEMLTERMSKRDAMQPEAGARAGRVRQTL